MLRLPDDVKALFSAPNVRRNFRVIFPDGERADLTNADVVQESVSFSESVCSESVFRFGCCERSMIEFETVGVENIQSARIECGLEVELTSLGDQYISYLQLLINDGLMDGAVVPAADSDLGYPYYRLPYGIFFVDSCPRDHSDRQRRKVKAYTRDPLIVSPVESVRLSTYRPQAVGAFRAGARSLAAANICFNVPGNVAGWGMTAGGSSSEKYTWAEIQALGAQATASFSSTADGHTYTLSIVGKYAVADFTDKASVSAGDPISSVLKRLTMSGWDSVAAWKWYSGLLSAAGAPEPSVAAHSRLPRTYLQPHIGYDVLDQYGSYDHAPIYWLPNEGCPYYIQDIDVAANKANGFVRLVWDLSCTWSVDGSPQEIRTFFPLADLTASIDAVSITNNDTIQVEATNEIAVGNVDQYTFVDSYDVVGMLTAPLELRAQQVRVTRTGIPAVIRMSNASPSAVPVSSVEEIFWDDADVSPIGLLNCKKMSFSQGQSVAVPIPIDGGGSSVYDMMANSLLQQPGVYYSDSAILTAFSPWLPTNQFVPYSATIHDMPWVQAGDCLSLATPDPDVPSLTSFVLMQTIRGVQSLTQEIGANGGTVIMDPNAVGTAMRFGGSGGSSGGSGGGGGGEISLPISFFSSVEQLSLTSGSATISGAFAALPCDAILVCPSQQFVTGSTGVPINANGVVTMVKSNTANRCYVQVHYDTDARADYTQRIVNGAPSGTWTGVPQTTMANSLQRVFFALASNGNPYIRWVKSNGQAVQVVWSTSSLKMTLESYNGSTWTTLKTW